MTPERLAHLIKSMRHDAALDPEVRIPVYDLPYLTELADWLDKIPAGRLNPWHTVTIKATSWHMAHPITCDLTDCPFDWLAAGWDSPPTDDGTWRWHRPEDWPPEWERETVRHTAESPDITGGPDA